MQISIRKVAALLILLSFFMYKKGSFDKILGIQKRVENSRFEPWSIEFKEQFVRSCMGNNPNEQAANQILCSCLTDQIEAAHVVLTKYNNHSETEAQRIEKNVASINEFLKSTQGQIAFKTCQEITKRKIASEK